MSEENALFTDAVALIDPMMEVPPSDHVVELSLTDHLRWPLQLSVEELKKPVPLTKAVLGYLSGCSQPYTLSVKFVVSDVFDTWKCDRTKSHSTWKLSWEYAVVFASANDALMFRLAIA